LLLLFYWSRNGGEWCSIVAAALMTMMVIVMLAVIVVEGRVLLPTGRDLSLSFSWPLSALAEVLYLRHCCHCRCRLCCCVVVVIAIVVVERRCYLRCFRFSFSLLSRCQHRFAPLTFGLVASPPL